MANLPAVIKRLKNGAKTKIVYPETLTKAVYDETTGDRLDNTLSSLNDSLAYSSYVVETTITGMTTTRIGTYTTDYSKTFVLGFIIDLDGNSYNSNGSTDEEQVWLYNGGIYMRGTTTSKIGRPIKIILGVLK